MAKKPTINTIGSGYASKALLNNNFEALRDAFDNTLSLDGSTPNAMGADLDLNSNNINNVASISAGTMTLGGTLVSAVGTVFTSRGNWATTTSYAINDIVTQNNSLYLCIVAHTSGTFSTDLAANNWTLLFVGPDSYADADVDTHLNTSTATSGEYLSWNGSDYNWATVPAGYSDSDVDLHLNYATATSGQILSYNGSDYDWITAASGATGGGSDQIFWENGQTVTTDYTITNGKNAMSAGPITINTGITVTVGAGETWTVV